MQRETNTLYAGLQLYQLNSPNVISAPNQNLPRGFPFEGSTSVQGICLPQPGPTSNSPPRWLILRIDRYAAPFPFDRLIVDRDNNGIPGECRGRELNTGLGEGRKQCTKGGEEGTRHISVKRGAAAWP
jgi:hypothetical protein